MRLTGYKWFEVQEVFVKWQKENPEYVIQTVLPDPDGTAFVFVTYHFTEPYTSTTSTTEEK